jgi:hypothetical protein
VIVTSSTNIALLEKRTRRARVDTPRTRPAADPPPVLDRLDADELAAAGDDPEDHRASIFANRVQSRPMPTFGPGW